MKEANTNDGIKGKKYLILLILYIALKPVYLFESGGIQICDAVMLFAIICNAISTHGKLQIRKSDSSFFLVLICLVTYQFIVNMIWYLIYPDLRLWMSSAFYIYNVMSFMYFIEAEKKYGIDTFKRSIVVGIILSEVITIVGIIINRGVNERAVGFFNNPNQLALHGLLLITLLFFTNQYANRLIKYGVASIAVIFIILSASKAGLLALFAFAFFCIIFADNTDKYSRAKKMVLLIIVAILIVSFFFSSSKLFTSNNTIMYMRFRILSMNGEADSNLAIGRGYARILETGGNFLWGMGEGAYDRFQIMHDHEVHSMIANIIVSYGFIGLVGYTYLFAFLIKDRNRTLFNFAGISGVLFYSITHNCIRNTLLWMVFALLYINKSERDTLKY